LQLFSEMFSLKTVNYLYVIYVALYIKRKNVTKIKKSKKKFLHLWTGRTRAVPAVILEFRDRLSTSHQSRIPVVPLRLLAWPIFIPLEKRRKGQMEKTLS